MPSASTCGSKTDLFEIWNEMKNGFLQNQNKFAKNSTNGVKNTSLAWYWANLSAVKIWTLNFNHNAGNAASSFKN